MLKVVSVSIALLGVAMVVFILAHAGISNPKALLGAVVMTIYFGSASLREHRFSRAKQSSEFLTEKRRVEALLAQTTTAVDFEKIVSDAYRVTSRSRGLSMVYGVCVIVDFANEFYFMRYESIDGKVKKLTIEPKYKEA